MTHMAHMDETYLHLVTSLLMEKDTLFRADRSDSMTSEDRDDFLPLESEFLIPQRDRAFSWDVSFEEGLSGEAIQALIAEQTRAPFYKPMLPPTTVSTKASANMKIPAIIEEDLAFSKLLGGPISKKESLPIKKRKISEKSESASKKAKNEKNEKLSIDTTSGKTILNVEGESKVKTQSPATTTTLDSKAAAAKKAAIGLKVEDRTAVKNESVQASNFRLPSVSPVPPISPLNNGLITPVTNSPSLFQHGQGQGQMLLPLATWNDYGVFQSTDVIRTAPSSNTGLISSGLQMNINLSRIPLLASDFGPANGIVIGDGCRVGVYTREERLVRIERFREKKLKRIWRKQIKYDCRKRLADTRPRVKGRFVSRIGENGEELPPEPKPEVDTADGKKKKKKLPKACLSSTTPTLYNAFGGINNEMTIESNNGGDTTQESEEGEGEDAGDSICSDGADSLSLPMTLGEGIRPISNDHNNHNNDHSHDLINDLNHDLNHTHDHNLGHGNGHSLGHSLGHVHGHSLSVGSEQELDENMQISLEDSLGHIIDIICEDANDHDTDMT